MRKSALLFFSLLSADRFRILTGRKRIAVSVLSIFFTLSSAGLLADTRSLFDTLFLKPDEQPGQYSIPFPFGRVIEKIERQLGYSINGDPNVAKSTLIPLGRCINRYAAGPEYFKFPRIVVAVDSEHNGVGEWNRPFMKDRMFLGYQEKANAIEVISYNEQRGQFDFQVVSNYANGETPLVRVIEDTQCTDCHQNNGPIFSRSNWDETEFNNEIFQRIVSAKFGPDSGSSRLLGSGAASVDLSTNRANTFGLFQTFWQKACLSDDNASEFRCRAGLFQMALEHRLQESNRTLIPPRLFTEYLIPVSKGNAERYWPDGVSFPSSDIKNQNPLLVGELLHLKSAESLKSPRPFLIKWNPANIFRIVEGLGGFIPFTEIRKLDQMLFDVSGKEPTFINFRGNCRLRRIDEIKKLDDENNRSGDIAVRCSMTEGALSTGVGFSGDFHITAGAINANIPLSNMYLDSANFIVGLSHRGGHIRDAGGRSSIKLSLFNAKRQLRARLPTGAMLHSIEISWPSGKSRDALFSGNQTVIGKAKLTAIADTGLLDAKMDRLVAHADRGDSMLFSERPFPGAQLMDALFKEFLAGAGQN